MGGQQLSPKSWHKEIKRCGALWRSMDSQHRDQYKAKAAEEQALRENACFEPLPPKMPHLDLPPAVSEIQGTAAEHLCRNAKKRISRQRVLTSYMKFCEASEWQELDGGVCDPDGALALDYIDMHSSEETVFQEWDTFAKPTTEPPNNWKGKGLNTDIHNAPCHADFGVCKSSLLLGMAQKFVYSLSSMIADGFWAAGSLYIL